MAQDTPLQKTTMCPRKWLVQKDPFLLRMRSFVKYQAYISWGVCDVFFVGGYVQLQASGPEKTKFRTCQMRKNENR